MSFMSTDNERTILNVSERKFSFPIRLLVLFFILLQSFLVNGQTPTITDLSSDICAGGSITITGTNFVGITAADVKIGTTSVSSITSYTSTQIIADVNAACSGNVNVSTVNGTATSSGVFTSNAFPAAPTVTTPINYCLNDVASQLTAIGSNLTWGNGPVTGTAGGSNVLSTWTYLSNSFSNKKTSFTTTAPNVKITSVNYYLPAWQAITGLQIGIFNSSGTLIATSGTVTTMAAGSTAVPISNIFNYTITVAGNYSIGVTAGTGTVGSDSPAFPMTEPSGTINVTGTENLGTAPYHCFNNIQFVVDNPAIAPTPSTSATGTTNYAVSQTVDGCVSPQATISVIVNNPPSAAISYTGTPFCMSLGTAQSVTLTGTNGGTFSASPSGLSLNSSTGAITPSTSTTGTYTVTYTIAASGGCSAYTTTASITIEPSVETPGFALGSTSARCQGAGSVTYNATAINSTSITYSLDATSISGSNSINSSTGTVTYSATWDGTSTITAYFFSYCNNQYYSVCFRYYHLYMRRWKFRDNYSKR